MGSVEVVSVGNFMGRGVGVYGCNIIGREVGVSIGNIRY